MINKGYTYAILLIVTSLLSSCISNKEVALLQNANLSFDEPKTFNNSDVEYRLQASDVLAIRFKSIESVDTDYINLQTTGSQPPNYDGQLLTFMTGFSISDSGYIHLPSIGKVKVSGLTVEEARAFIQRKIDDELIETLVLVNLVSFKISILGEVQSPGYYHIYNNRATVLDGLALAGGFKEFANRQGVMLIRQTQTGSEAISLDITSEELLRSPYYYLQPNDAIVIQPLQVKHQRSNLANLNIIGVVISGISTAVSVITVIELLKN